MKIKAFYEIDETQNKKGKYNFRIRYKGDVILFSNQGYEDLSTMRRVIKNVTTAFLSNNFKINKIKNGKQ